MGIEGSSSDAEMVGTTRSPGQLFHEQVQKLWLHLLHRPLQTTSCESLYEFLPELLPLSALSFEICRG